MTTPEESAGKTPKTDQVIKNPERSTTETPRTVDAGRREGDDRDEEKPDPSA
ncbi:hypothetical protein GCM10010145_20060 [Streptomyces ruber]|uniref:Uncharacterized protein n=2 Tax=Streptomyces TaxID=1883 RepID=A0A918BA76_9ACTN|nr:hypothetical protein [Streptomyces ruber]GGQ50921.1 hypothetical protein GCM10010145_20060 [Streptomyces ruber]